MKKIRQKYLSDNYYIEYKRLRLQYIVDNEEGWANNHANFFEMFDLFSLDYTYGEDISTLEGYVKRLMYFMGKAYEYDVMTEREDEEYTGRILNRNSLIEIDIGIISLTLMFYPNNIGLLRNYIYPYQPQDPLVDTMINLDHPDFQLTDKKFQRGFLFRKNLYQALISDKPEAILKYLKAYLVQWYESHRKLGYRVDGHLEEDMDYANYIGYWSFEAAFVAYYKDIDDTELHEFIYYPKDLVTWLKENKGKLSFHKDDSRKL